MNWYWIVAIVYGVMCLLSLPGIAACMLSSKISQEEEKRDEEMPHTGSDRR